MVQDTVNTYEQSAIDFLKATDCQFSVKYVKTGKYFPDDKEDRDIYSITLKRGGRYYTFQFGQSIFHSGKYKGHKHLCLNQFGKLIFSENEYKAIKNKPGGSYTIQQAEIKPNKDFEEPTAYSVLSCLTKYDPGTFEDFCSEFGYDEDSKKAEKTYKAVKEEYVRLCGLFTDAEMEQLQEIN